MKNKFITFYNFFNKQSKLKLFLAITITAIIYFPFIYILSRFDDIFETPLFNFLGFQIYFVFPFFIPIIILLAILFYEKFYVFKTLLFISLLPSCFFNMATIMGVLTRKDELSFFIRCILPYIIFFILLIIILKNKKSLVKE